MAPEVRATYRVQLHAGFTFDHVAEIAPYLRDLGVSHVYCSPYLQAAPGSTHGYDVVDHGVLNRELGGEEAYERMCDALAAAGLSHILDIVPNHVAVGGRANPKWWDVLKNGRASRYASFFDIEWDPPSERLKDKVLVPVLGAEPAEVIASGELHLEREGEEIIVRYHEHELPLASGTAPASTSISAEGMRDLLGRQHYVLDFWRKAASELNYRRFFDINTLAAVRVEEPRVFEETHDLVLKLIARGTIEGLRVDHIDGLWDPEAYLAELRSRSGGVYTVVEKILEVGEELPPYWQTEGTSGYDFLNLVNPLFVDREAEAAIDSIYSSFTGESLDLERVVRDKKLLVMGSIMGSDINRLVARLAPLAEGASEEDLRVALEETIASFPVYRTYVRRGIPPAREDLRVIEGAVARARKEGRAEPGILDVIEHVLLCAGGGDAGMDFALRFQQATGPIMAKGLEDTVFYNFNRFVSLNEVGGDPGQFGITLADWHERCTVNQSRWPRSLLATSTHDTKRSEDVRARLNLLSEMTEEWRVRVDRWGEGNDKYKSEGWPDRNAEYLLYQNLVGAWPVTPDRAVAYMRKATKEAKSHTSWIDPTPAYDEAVERFTRAILADDSFTRDVDALVRTLEEPARITSLAQTLLKLTAPGIPDIYQGTELWDLSLVDPDNRRPVDHHTRRALLRDLLDEGAGMGAAKAWAGQESGLPKLFLIQRTLNLRRRRPGAFGVDAPYAPVSSTGEKAAHVVAYTRAEELAVVAPRLVMGTLGGWGDTAVDLPEGRWTNELAGRETAGGSVLVSELLAAFPVALLVRS